VVPDSGYALDPNRGEIGFTTLATPPPGANVTARYEAACVP